MTATHPPLVYSTPDHGPVRSPYRQLGGLLLLLVVLLLPPPILVAGVLGLLLDRALGPGLGAGLVREIWGESTLLIFDDEGVHLRVAGASRACLYPWSRIEDLGLARSTPRCTLTLRLRGRAPVELDLEGVDGAWTEAAVAARAWLAAGRDGPRAPDQGAEKKAADSHALEGRGSFLECFHAPPAGDGVAPGTLFL